MGPTEVLVVFAKAPFPGRVKTRLAASIGDEAACSWYRRCAEHVVSGVTAGSWHTQLWVDASDAVDAVGSWLRRQPLVQQGDDLGKRMLHAITHHAPARCVIVGTDAPDVNADTVRAAFDALDEHDVVLGPAYDGGYYLIGMRQPRAELFDGIAWSTDQVLTQTLTAATAAGASVHLLPPLRDIDTVEDLQWYAATSPSSTLAEHHERT
ncbi:MAG: glycosyltransferase [Candidatus Kapabacteria bacterium]|nr:glycosyltransferase [Candidatus Kapabacteria bacterium]